MFNNVGAKCKVMAKVFCWIGIIGSILLGLFIMFFVIGTHALIGIPVMIIGSLVSWLSSLALFAIGEAAENSAIAANLAIETDMEMNDDRDYDNDIDEYDNR